MATRNALKHLGGATAVYVIVAACSGARSDSQQLHHDASVMDSALDALVDPVQEAEAATPPCANWELKITNFEAGGQTQASADWEPVSLSTTQSASGNVYWVLARRCAN